MTAGKLMYTSCHIFLIIKMPTDAQQSGAACVSCHFDKMERS